MSISYDTIDRAFLNKITEYSLLDTECDVRQDIVDGYMRRAVVDFSKECVYDLSLRDDNAREFTDSFDDGDVDEIVEIISEGMVLQWMKPYLYHADNLQNVLNTRDYTLYSPAELTRQIRGAYESLRLSYKHRINEYSVYHNDLTKLHI